MEIINPYAPPETHVSETRSHEGKGISWWYHFVIATFLLPVWFFVGFAISIGGSRSEMLIDLYGFVAILGYAGFAFLFGVVRHFRE